MKVAWTGRSDAKKSVFSVSTAYYMVEFKVKLHSGAKFAT